mgnify:CR=1 FL=1
MTTGERKKFVLSWIAGVIGFIIVTLSLCTEDTSGEYLERGQKVEATITKVVLNKAYYGVYVDSNGKQVQAEILPNNFSSGVGTVVEGYYLPEEPNKVWCEPSKGLLIALDCLTWFFEIVLGLGVLGGIWVLIGFRKIDKERNQEIWKAGMEEYQQEIRKNDEKLWGDAKRWNMDDRWDDTQRWNDSGYWNEGQRWNDDGRWE